MFGIGFPELILILLVVLVVFGPAKLPELAQTLGKALKEFRKATNDFQAACFEDEYKQVDKEKKEEDVQSTPKAESHTDHAHKSI